MLLIITLTLFLFAMYVCTIFYLGSITSCIVTGSGKIITANRLFTQTFTNTKHLNELKFDGTVQDRKGRHWMTRITNLQLCKLVTFTLEIDWVSQIPLPICITNADGLVLKTNESFPAEVGANIYDFISQAKSKQMQVFLHNAGDWNSIEVLWSGQFVVKLFAKRLDQAIVLLMQKDLDQLRLKAANAQHLQLIGSFATAIAHDFNNILTAITNSCYLQEYGQIHSIVDKAQLLIQQIVQLSQNSLERTCQPNDVIVQAEHLLQSVCNHDIRVKFSLTATNPTCVLSTSQVLQIILNLVLNAYQAGASIVHITTKEEQCDKTVSTGFIAGSFVVIDVQDNGPGITLDNQQQVFKQFFTTKQTGTGIGLASIKHIVTLEGGGIHLTSANSGALFSIYIPIFKQQKDIRMNIVLAEDDEMVRSLTCKILQRQGYDVIAVQDGLQAMNNINAGTHILITDAIMPNMNGVQLIQWTRATYPQVKIILLSGVGSQELEEHVPVEVTILTKPIQVKKLIELIQSINAHNLSTKTV